MSLDIFREHWHRSTLPNQIATDPEQLYERMLEQSLTSYEYAEHYEAFSVAATMVAFDNGNAKLLSGANFKLGPGRVYKCCAEQALLFGAARETDALVDVIMVRGPEVQKPIEGSRRMNSLHPCDACRNSLLEKVGGGLLVVTFTGESTEPDEAVPLSLLINYHDRKGAYPRTFGNPKERALNRLAEIAIPASNFEDLVY